MVCYARFSNAPVALQIIEVTGWDNSGAAKLGCYTAVLCRRDRAALLRDSASVHM